MATPTELLTAAESKLDVATAAIADARALVGQAKSQLPAPIPIPPDPIPIPPTTGLVKSLTHLGSFNVPVVPGGDQAGYAYGGTALGFRAENTSLYVGGFRDRALVGEITIPAFGQTAKTLQTPKDPTGGKLPQIDPSDGGLKVIGGTLVYGNNLIISAFVDYDADGTQVLSHFVRDKNLSSGAVQGPLRVGPLNAGFYSGYMAPTDPAWVGKLKGPALTGNACINIVARTSLGPSVASFDPANINNNAVELVGYPLSHPTLGPYSAASKYYGGSDQIAGMVMPFGTGSVLFFGRHGTTYCYGEAPPCNDPTSPYKGPHGYPYRTVCWLYNAADLADVAAGKKQPWDVLPYDMIDVPGMKSQALIGGAAFDPATGIVYLSELRGNGTLPVIHAYQVKS